MGSSDTTNRLTKDATLRSCRELILKWARVNFSTFMTSLDERLFELADKSDNNEDQTRFFQARDEFKRQQNFLQRQYLQHMSTAFDQYRGMKNTASDYSHELIKNYDSDSEIAQPLSLVDNSELEEKIAIGSMSRKTSADCSEHLYALNQRFSALSSGKKITDLGNPIAPAVFAEAMQASVRTVNIDDRTKILIYKIFESSFMAKIKKLYELLNHDFTKRGVLPNLSHYIKKSESVKAPIAEQLPKELQGQVNKTSIDNQVNLFETIRQLQQQLRPQNTAQARQANRITPEHIIASIQQLQEKAGAVLHTLTTPQEVSESDYRSITHQAVEEAKKDAEVDTDVIEIVGLLFEYMLNDEQLPDSVKALLSYLHTPFLKIALQDKDFFDHPEHPARQLLNSLVAAGERWVEPFGKHKSDVFNQIKATVSRLLSEFDNDVRLFSELAFEFNQYLRQHSRRIRLAEKRAKQAAEGENKLKEIRLKVDGYLKQKVGDQTLPPPINTLLFEPWANFLSFNLLRFGSRSEQWRRAAETADDILWYWRSAGSQDAHSKSRAQDLMQSLPKVLQAGFDTVGYDSSQAILLLKALFEQQPPPAAKEAQDPIAANIDEVDISKHAETAIRNDELQLTLKKTKFGTWFEFDANTKTPKRYKLSWANTNTLHFMFVNRMGQQVAVIQGDQLADDIRNGKVKILSTLEDKPFFEKAMERVLEQLRDKDKP